MRPTPTAIRNPSSRRELVIIAAPWPWKAFQVLRAVIGLTIGAASM